MPTLSQVLQQAISYHQAGQLSQAEPLYRKILQVDPKNADAFHLLGLIAYQVNQYDLATQLIQTAIQFKPQTAEFYHNLGTVKNSQKQFTEAIECYQQAIRHRPDYAEAYHNLGNVFTMQNRLPEAIECYRHALQWQPNYPEAHNNLGNVLKEQGQFEGALACFQQALARKPDSATAYHNLGHLHLKQGKLSEAETYLRQAIRLDPTFVEAYCNLGNVFLEQGQLEEAIPVLQQALHLNPQFVQAHGILGNVFAEQERFTEAQTCYENALQLHPQDAHTYNNLGNVYSKKGFLEEAIDCYQRAISFQPTLTEAHTNLGNTLQSQGKIQEAIAYYRKVLELKPDFAAVHSSLLFLLNYSVDHDPTTIFAEHQQFNERYAKPLTLLGRNPVKPRNHGGRRLKIGYVSSDFFQHSVAYFIEPILAHHDRQQFEIFCYYNNTQDDEVTRRIQGYADHFLACTKLSDEALADRIRQDQIDILVDLMGHSGKNRLLTFARTPAPLSITYLGYPNTTGLTTIDYRLTDHYADPEGLTESFHSETLVRLPQSFLCYRPFEDSPPIVPSPPVTRYGYLTFGCFNNYAKINRPLLHRWAQILRVVTNSKLMIKLKSLRDRDTCQKLEEQLTHWGITPDRLILIGITPTTAEHLSIYNDVDIALDTFPYCGTTTTCEALWMGVPVVTQVGSVHASRVGLSLLSNVGLPELITHTPEDYVKTCIRLAQEKEYLETFRKTIRTRMQNSPLLDAMTRTRELETIYQTMVKK